MEISIVGLDFHAVDVSLQLFLINKIVIHNLGGLTRARSPKTITRTAAIPLIIVHLGIIRDAGVLESASSAEPLPLVLSS